MQNQSAGRLSRALFFAGLSLAACAPMPAGEGESYAEQSSVDVTQAVPEPTQTSGTSPGGTSPSQSSNANTKTTTSTGTSTSTTFVPPAGTVGKAAAYPGMSIRWHNNPNMCITRQTSQPTDIDPLTLAPCAADTKQAFTFSFGGIYVTDNYGWAHDLNTGAISLRANSNRSADNFAPTYINFTGDGATNTFSSNGTGFLVPKDLTGKAGTPIVIDKTSTGGAPSIWDLVGVGNVGGTLLSLPTNHNPQASVMCVAAGANSATVAPCDRTAAEQRWRYDSGFFVSDTGRCLTCNTTSTLCALQSCSTVTKSPVDQRWALGFSLYYQASVNGSKLTMECDTSAKTVYLGSGSDISADSNVKGQFEQIGDVFTTSSL